MNSRIALWITLGPIAFVIAIAIAALASQPAHPAVKLAISTVIVSDDTGHGSGVHIGNGYILTAAHVTEDKATMQIVDSLGHKQTGTVLWSNKAYDVALIRVDSYAGIKASRIACHGALAIGAAVEAIGNPLNLEFIRTWGHVASLAKQRKPWQAAFIADITIAPDSSGGPVFDRNGNVVGLAVGISVQASGFGQTAFPFSYVVPSRAACLLMARTAT